MVRVSWKMLELLMLHSALHSLRTRGLAGESKHWNKTREKYGMLTTFISELSTNEITSIDLNFTIHLLPKYLIFNAGK